MKLSSFVAAILLLAGSLFAQAGHWEGAIQTPGPALKIVVDLAKDAQGAWTGAISIPDQNLTGFPLSGIVAEGGSIRFQMQGVPGTPSFNGKLSVDGKTIEGPYTQGGREMTFKMTRSGEAQFAKSTPITKDVEGEWDGALQISAEKQLRLIFKLANKDGVGTGTLVSVDQGNSELPIKTVIQTGSNLSLNLPEIGASFTGEIGKGEIKGEFTQGPKKFPLTLKKK